MAHFAKIGMNGKVIQVTTMSNEVMKDDQGNEVEANGQQWLERHNNWPSQMWIQTSYNTSQNKHSSGDDSKAFRGNYAGIGYTWDEDNQIFWPKQPFPSWVKDLDTASWKSPIGDAPELTEEEIEEDKRYNWNEGTQAWDLTN
tara:strand:- start:8794 stop:9222 length:429 start_codon:yes stop_codon:yes gene_type:complete